MLDTGLGALASSGLLDAVSPAFSGINALTAINPPPSQASTLQATPAADPGQPDIVVGRTLSSYSTSEVQNNELTITYTVYNEREDALNGVLLATTLQPGVTFENASALPDRNGQELAWSLGTVDGYGRASVQLTVSLTNPTPVQLDSGAHAFGTLIARAVSDDAPAATLRTDALHADLLKSTPDANTTDPFVQEKAAELDYSPQRIFDYLRTEVGYESYKGSLRGAGDALEPGGQCAR